MPDCFPAERRGQWHLGRHAPRGQNPGCGWRQGLGSQVSSTVRMQSSTPGRRDSPEPASQPVEAASRRFSPPTNRVWSGKRDLQASRPTQRRQDAGRGDPGRSGRVDLGGCPPRCRVAREHCCSPAPSERHVNLSVYAAQASPKAPRGTRWGASAPPARYWSGADGRDTPETAPAASCRHLLCLPSQLFRRSRAETPEGSQPAFAWDDLAGGLNLGCPV